MEKPKSNPKSKKPIEDLTGKSAQAATGGASVIGPTRAEWNLKENKQY
jgi:hypothetical protein